MLKAAQQSALRTLATERAGLEALAEAIEGDLGPVFSACIERFSGLKGRVIVTGMGKSGHIGKKIAATFASTGTPAFFVHPSEASHGDLGMITADDAVIALSWSGETRELGDIIDYATRFNVPLVAVTSVASSTLAKAADLPLVLPQAKEACPNGQAPTTSSLMILALGDALAMAMLESRGFTAADFRVFHPGGKLGASLKFVRDVMRTGDAVPLVTEGTLMSEAILVMSKKGVGSVGVLDASGMLVGIATDGDLRRHMSDDLMTRRVDDIMTRTPKVIRPEALVSEAMEVMDTRRIAVLFAVEGGRPVGVVHMLDLLNIGVV
ncbi:KpsF/GutQ family sugar-phosphate isomerase [Labrys neptuniae]|uniref:KpsF/GutQ family sugar-phosphate isomerase n=1 Tax=Labrys TaxID=204476 RepID=UPI00288DA984|nr:KpsF/GutQ family sugar-phosphate isomerase [Labrys neptuniae]MDT3377246.1 KpsF/GutQ family sugar-phosphate isomerase [Labrys neptuniae]